MEIHSSTRDRLAYVLDHQAHCDLNLPRIANPAGKSVLVVGSEAGTEMLWSLRMGAREVVGIDLLPQDPEALRLAAARVGIPADRHWEMRREDPLPVGLGEVRQAEVALTCSPSLKA